MANITIESVEGVPAQEGEDGSMPAFLVRGTWKGQPFTYEVAVELDGRDAEWDHKEGVDPQNDPDGPDWDQWLDENSAVFDAIWASPAFKEASEAYQG